MPGVAASLLLVGAVLAPLVDGTQLGPGWRVATLPGQRVPVTRFTPELVQGRESLRIEAQRSYGNYVHDLQGLPAPAALAWSWRLEAPAPSVDLQTKAGDDTPAKVCLSFDLPMAQVPFIERQLLRLARARTGEPLPAATLCWVWGGSLPRETVLDNPFSRRVRYVVLRQAADPAQTWLDEKRDVAADFLRAFGDESSQVPPVIAVIVAGDGDNAAGHSVAHVADLRFEP